MSPTPETPVQKRDCIIAECNKAPKGFKTTKGLKGHMKKFHDVVFDAFSPVAASARVLFDSGREATSVQGNSHGQITSPMVATEGIFQCGKCPEQFRSRDDVKNHMDKQHDNARADEPNDNLAKTGLGNKDMEVAESDTLDNDSDNEEDLATLMEDIEDGDIAKNLEKRAAADKIVESFVEIAFREMHPTEVTSNKSCHECECKDENLVKLDRLLGEKDALLEEKSATIRGMSETLRKNVKTRVVMQKKVDQVDKVKKKLADKQKENARLRVLLETKEALGEVETTTARPEANKQAEQEIIVDAVLKKCKKCNFTAPNMNVLGLHMENDHQYEFECSECSKKFPFKNQLKIHRRELHEEGTFSCFVCNNRFKTHKELRQHIQKKCKSPSTANPTPAVSKQIVHKHNEDILVEDEHKCTMCPKITNNQVSLIHHINTTHMHKTDKCDSCGQEFENKSTLIEHIVEKHTVKGTQIIPRHVCKVCNVEVHGDEARNNHICRKHMDACSFCKKKFYSREAVQEHICSEHSFKSVDDQLLARKRKTVECSHGVDCYRARRGRCWFKHSQPVNMIPQGGQGQLQQHEQLGQGKQQGHPQGQVDQQGHLQGRGQQQGHHQGQGQQQQGHQGQWQQQQGQRGRTSNSNRSKLYCRYQEKCHKGPQTCTYKHFQQGFLQENLDQNHQ